MIPAMSVESVVELIEHASARPVKTVMLKMSD
jgi:hypothetical protein